MVIVGKNKVTVHDVLIGDVWLASGQSNMEFTLGRGPDDYMVGVANMDQEVRDTAYPQLRLFKVHRKAGLKPADDAEADTWAVSTPETAANFSAVAYLFGREIHKRYHIPVGLIETSWGGTVAEAWISEGGLKSFPEFQQSIESLKHIDEKSATAEYDQYVKQKAAWDGQHAAEDRGRVDGHDIWAATDLNTSSWLTIVEPQTKAEEALKGFDGVVWFRKELDVPAEDARKDLSVHLAYAYKSDTTFFNGEKIGETQGGDKPKDYLVPGKLVKAGRNVIAVRIKGIDGFVGMYSDDAAKLNVEVAGEMISLAGPWSYEPGPDLAALPEPSAYAKLQSDPNKPMVLFNGMLAPLTPYRIKGAIWYQGEANADRPTQYRTLFPALIQDWRSHWGYELPFLFVQLAGFQPNKPEPTEYPWAELREAQRMALSLPATGMSTAVDIGDENDIHPRNKQDVAHRLVLAAAKVAYGENIVYSGPVYQSMQIEGNRARIKFSNLGSGLLLKDKYGYGRGFEIAGADGKFHWAQARQDAEDVVVFNSAITAPVAVRYDWSNTPDGNVFNKDGLPAVPFRTDSPKP
jgi:sialate O-acetylesterase